MNHQEGFEREQGVRHMRKSEKLKSTTIYIRADQDHQLKMLKAVTGVPVAEYIRQGIAAVLEQNEDKLADREEAWENLQE